MAFIVETSGSNDFGPCSCCGHMSRTVWGYLNREDQTVAVYYVQWTLGRLDHGANFDLIVGPWDSDSSADDRSVVAVAYRLTPKGPQFMVIDALERPAAKSTLAKTALKRGQVIGTPLAAEIFAMVDAIWLHDGRIRELAGNPN